MNISASRVKEIRERNKTLEKDPEVRLLIREGEEKAEKLVDWIRIASTAALIVMSLIRGFTGIAAYLTYIPIAFAVLYSFGEIFIINKGQYRKSFMWISMTVDHLLITTSMLAARLSDSIPEQAGVIMTSRFALYFVFIALSVMRYNLWLSFYSGILSGVLYLCVVMIKNPLFTTGENGVPIWQFILVVDGQIPENRIFMEIITKNEILRFIYMVLCGLVSGLGAQQARNQLLETVFEQREKREVQTENLILDADSRRRNDGFRVFINC